MTCEGKQSKIAKRKYHKRHHVEGAWIIDGIERSNLKNKMRTKKYFYVL
jgi:hypothetical protein